ncbi:MAG: hypothetical protein KF686_18845 [Ramlibacter sp.]|nr:hypothetical protein [Ramlibacter sp.]
MTIRKFLWLGVLSGTVMAVFTLYDLGDRPIRPLFIFMTVCVLLAGGVLFGIGMFAFTKLIARYASIDLSVNRRLKPGMRNWLLIVAAVVPSVAILGFVVVAQSDFLWAALAAGIGPTLTLVRLPVHLSRQSLVVRSLMAILIGASAAVAVSVGYLSQIVTPNLIATCVAYGAAWTFAQVVALAVRPLFQKAPLDGSA